MQTVSFTRMEDGTQADYEFLDRLAEQQKEELVDNIMKELHALSGSFEGYQIDRLEHVVQSATRAYHDDKDEEYVVCALLHDMGDHLSPDNHSEYAAAILRPYVSEANYWMVKHHGAFQMYYYAHHLGGDRHAREAFRDSPYFDRTEAFTYYYDQNCFDPDYENLPLEFFEPMLRRIFAREPFGEHVQAE
ncbi:HD domain-containing protein [Halofilum ochraceum]|uniref:HD domain-containing protein n=1 Tax=Halofilum ochraceum TaxID=1611323 RepID=UPI000835CAEC|nr:hypothetical protein [Halofilum ochraceum]